MIHRALKITLPKQSDMVERLARRPEIEFWVKEVWEPRDAELFHDTSKLAEFMLLREFVRRSRKASTLETLGLARLRFNEIDVVQSAPNGFTRHGKTIDDWRDYLHAIVIFFMRSNAAVNIHYNLMHWISPKLRPRSLLGPGQSSNGEKSRVNWPRAPKNEASVSLPQSLLITGLSLNPGDESHRADMEECLERAWHQLQAVLGNDQEHRSLDLRKARIAPVVQAFHCPVTRRMLDVAPFGLTPYARRGTQARREKASPVVMPKLPSALLGQVNVAEVKTEIRAWLESDPAISSLKALGSWSGISDRLSLFATYSRSAEHSAQQETSLLRRYEEDFKKGRINVLNCSTTMEMGVDIGSVSTVMMTNVPPSIANYRQRVGRAGRRNQAYSLAFTFCRDRPLDRETFTDPLLYLDRNVSAPRVALNSRPIVQRHVNAYLLRRFMLTRGGDALRMTMGAIMACPSVVGEKRPVKSERPVEIFMEWLGTPSAASETARDLEKLVARSVLEGETRLLDNTLQALTALQQGFVDEWEGLQALAKDEGLKEAGKTRMGIELKRLCEEFLLSALADRGFLPGHGFPTGVVTFVPHKPRGGTPPDGRRQYRLSGPQRSLDLAIRDYAPGSEVVLDGLVHLSAGVLLNWKRPASEEHIRDVQSLKFHWSCQRCGSSDTSRELTHECTSCGGSVRSEQYLRPSGFSIDSREKPHADTDTIYYVAPEPPDVSATGAEWVSLPMPELGRHRSNREGSVYFSNRGPDRSGYALCLHCGRAAPDHPELDSGGVDNTLPSPLDRHKPLRWKKAENSIFCEGNDSSWKVKRSRITIYIGTP